MSHRPLSVWVAEAPSTVGEELYVTEVNDGARRADARMMPKYASGWRRSALLLPGDRYALGLVHETTGEAVVEVDEKARPIRVTEGGAQFIARIEDSWPDARLDEAGLEALAAEEPAIRHLLLARLTAEGDPSALWFHILPWNLVSDLAQGIVAAIQGETPGPVIRLKHWFGPVGSRFSSALEQVDEGIRRQDPTLARVGATALCSRLLLLNRARIPMSTVLTLLRLVTYLAIQDRFLRYTASRIGDWFRGESTLSGGLRHGSNLPIAAGEAGRGVRRGREEIQREPFTIRLEITSGGRAEVMAHSALRPEDQVLIDERYGSMILPIRVSSASGDVRYHLILRRSSHELAGSLIFPAARAGYIRVDVDGPPTGTADAARLDIAEVERSLRSLPGARYQRLWHGVGRTLPDTHPLREIIERATI